MSKNLMLIGISIQSRYLLQRWKVSPLMKKLIFDHLSFLDCCTLWSVSRTVSLRKMGKKQRKERREEEQKRNSFIFYCPTGTFFLHPFCAHLCKVLKMNIWCSPALRWLKSFLLASSSFISHSNVKWKARNFLALATCVIFEKLSLSTASNSSVNKYLKVA